MGILWGLLAIVFGALFVWLVVFKLFSRLAARLGYSTPCPAAVGFLVDNAIRRRYIRPVIDRLGIRPAECVLGLAPAPGRLPSRRHGGRDRREG